MRLLAILALAVSLSPDLVVKKAEAHEFWISPDSYRIEAGDTMLAALRVGQSFSGSSFSYIPQNFVTFELVTPEGKAPVEGRMGDLPALKIEGAQEGLNVIVHQTTPLSLKWVDWEIFKSFCEHKDFAWAIEDHLERELPEKGFRESYTRYAKSLVGVGTAEGQDAVFGMETEIVALANPYTDDLSKGFPVKVLYQGKARMNVQVEVFARAPDGTVTDTFQRTDMEGKALIPVVPGTEYLLDAVVMRPLMGSVEEDTAVWESLWASLTFRTPE